MQKRCGRIKLLSASILLAGLSTIGFMPAAKADAIDAQYLAPIQTTTNSILTAVNNIPAYLTEITQMAMSFLATDNSSSDPVNWSTDWGNEQNWLSLLSTSAFTNETNQYSMQQSLLTNFFGASNLSATTPTPAYINDLSYPTLLGQLIFPNDTRSGNFAMNYLTYASGLGIQMAPLAAGGRGDAAMATTYTNMYNAITAVQTYNGFVLSRLYQDANSYKNDFPLRSQLIGQSSNSAWFSSVISNDLGWVLRQILLYNSQMYVLMDQMVQAQKQTVAAIAMNNTLLIANAQVQAAQILKIAQGS